MILKPTSILSSVWTMVSSHLTAGKTDKIIRLFSHKELYKHQFYCHVPQLHLVQFSRQKIWQIMVMLIQLHSNYYCVWLIDSHGTFLSFLLIQSNAMFLKSLCASSVSMIELIWICWRIRHITLIFTNLCMPRRDGWKACKKALDDQGNNSSPTG